MQGRTGDLAQLRTKTFWIPVRAGAIAAKFLLSTTFTYTPEPGQTIPYARAQLAPQLKIPMLLFTTIPPSDALKGKDSATAALLPRATEEVLRLAEQEAARHLGVHVRELQEMGVLVSGRVMRADPAEGVLATAREMHSDLIVLGAHTQSATQAFWSASMTPKILHQARTSFLLAPGEGDPLLPPPPPPD